MLFFTRQPEAQQSAGDGRAADTDRGVLFQVVAQRFSRLIGAALDLLTQQLEVFVTEAATLPAAVRAGSQVSGLPVLSEHLLEEGLADAERGGDLLNGGVAALDRRDDLLPQV
ncbi:MAG TPA: hypothetical protein VLJ61_08860 [Pyrinomonadaceae bacterium]|nr:hypothetical protein [Pyrinomonadaceae bacterium]